jgi:type II secretory pathway pseudopilin PulG
MLKTVLLLLLAYIAYRFIFGFVIPVSKATRNVRQQFKAAQEQMEAQMRAQQGYAQTQQEPVSRSEAKKTTKDYIDFEEVD